MKNLKFILSVFSFFFLFNINAQNTMGKAIKRTVKRFEEAISERDTKEMDKILHHDFRVIANRFMNKPTTTILSKEMYLDMMNTKKIGGDLYDISFQNITVNTHSASVSATFKNKKSTMKVVLLLVLNENEEWQIISDLAVIN